MVNYIHKNNTERQQKGVRNMTTLAGGIGFVMMLLGMAGGNNEDWVALTASLIICLVGIGLMFASYKLEQRKKRRYIYKRF